MMVNGAQKTGEFFLPVGIFGEILLIGGKAPGKFLKKGTTNHTGEDAAG